MPPRPRATRPYMPGYGTSSDESTLRPWSWAEEILRGAHNYWLGTARPDGRPHTMPIWGVWDGDAFWFSTGAGSRKAKNLAARAECTVAMEVGTGAVVIEGTAARSLSSALPGEVLRAYIEKYGEGVPPDSPIFCVAPRVVFGFSEAGDFAETATSWTFERE
jgi:Pyridoxamine 5'-phosphate oxidase